LKRTRERLLSVKYLATGKIKEPQKNNEEKVNEIAASVQYPLAGFQTISKAFGQSRIQALLLSYCI